MSLAWCPNCEFLTNDCSTPCHECGGQLEYATIEANENFIKASREYDETHLDPKLLEAQAELITLRAEKEGLLEIADAAYEALRWASGTEEHWNAEGILSALVKDYRDKYPAALSEHEAEDDRPS